MQQVTPKFGLSDHHRHTQLSYRHDTGHDCGRTHIMVLAEFGMMQMTRGRMFLLFRLSTSCRLSGSMQCVPWGGGGGGGGGGMLQCMELITGSNC